MPMIRSRVPRVRVVVLVMSLTFLASSSLLLFPRPPLTLFGWTAPSRGLQEPFSTGNSSSPAPCKRPLQFSAVRLPVTALASVQGSGNTWMRHLLQQLTGIYTGSIYARRGDPELWAQGYYGEGISNGSVIAVKTHGLPQSRFGRAIVIIRNPFDAMFADFNRRASASHTGAAPAAAYLEYWNDFSTEYATRWNMFHASWSHFQGPLLYVNFDDLAHSLRTVIDQVTDFLKHPSLEVNVRCALSGSDGVAKRGKVPFQKQDVFSRNLTLHINHSIRNVEKLLSDRFPQLAKAISVWKRNETGRKLQWKPLPRTIS